MSIANFITDAVGLWKQRPKPTVESNKGDPKVIDLAGAPPDTKRLIRNRQYCRVLSTEVSMPFDELSIEYGWRALEQDMAFVPGGEVCLVNDLIVSNQNSFQVVSSPDDLVSIEPIYLDRDCVTNADYLKFVQSEGYANAAFWPEEVLPNVLQFLDSTGCPGPKFWENGFPPEDQMQHPVVGICWYEANAYASWVGKRLPSTEEWQRAGTWTKGQNGANGEIRFPWGNGFDPSKANLWASNRYATVPITEYDEGNTPNGIRQLIGNVWEWVDTQFYPHAQEGVSVMLDQTMAETRGGAYDTYFHSQATCQFRTGQPLLFRGENIGFRCCISTQILAPRASDSDSQNTSQDPS